MFTFYSADFTLVVDTDGYRPPDEEIPLTGHSLPLKDTEESDLFGMVEWRIEHKDHQNLQKIMTSLQEGSFLWLKQ